MKFSENHFFKLIAFLIILSTLPVMITGSLSFWQSSKAMVNLSNEEKLQNIYQVRTNVEKSLQYIDFSITNFVRSSQTQQLLSQNIAVPDFTDYHQLRRDLIQLQTMDTGIEDIVVASFEHNWLMSNNGIEKLDYQTYEQIKKSYMHLEGRSSWILEKAEMIKFPTDIRNTCPQYINLVKMLPLFSGEQNGLVSVFIPTCEITDIISEKNTGDSFLIIDNDKQIIANTSPETSITLDFDKLDMTEKSGQTEYLFNGTDYKLIYEKSEYTGWTYLSLVKLSTLKQKSASIGWITLLIVSILTILSFLFAIISTRVLYKPINHLKTSIINYHDSKSPLTGTNEFQLIESHIHNLSLKNTQLEKRAQSQILPLKQLFMIRLIQGQVTEDEIPVKLKQFHYPEVWGWLTIFSLKIDQTEHDRFKEDETDLVLFAINNIIEDIIPPTDRFTPFILDDIQSTVIISRQEQNSRYTRHINQKAEFIQKEVFRLLNIHISIGISERFKKLRKAESAYKESKEALKYRLKLNKSAIIFYENLNRNYSTIAPFPNHIKKNIFDAIKISDKAKVTEEIEALFEYITKHVIHPGQIETMLSRFLYELYELKEVLGIHLDQLENAKMITHFKNLATLREMEDWLIFEITLPLIEKIEEKDTNKYKKISDQVIELIHNNYTSEISLDAIAAKLHYNVSYLSGVFQKETGSSFSEYLLQYRLDKAKTLLRTTDKSVKQIAEELRYKNSQNFIRSFKKMEGMTPGNYRLANKG
ncbi:Helix-turn-helix domain-containing protein [Gracilibacillus ureilyticus]|uniref:Helix-turn-helix domain-containing protein n=1 Tax=Gracilibacillus ureilyticus TaxID=531814 RepID=A0A1H9U794_9BACI|nr:helix-turn-helix domain-containing protein [Gracilibacillus ureilyticus]SES05346.1 Helix-turn-helix domain-containing protein [Gracilibacillus ureilyticus]